MKRTFLALCVFFSVTAGSHALAQSEFYTVELTIDIDASAEHVWDTVGGFCDIGEWGGLPCEITAGDGGMGTVRSLLGGAVVEVLVGLTELSYGYVILPPANGSFDNKFHGFMEARPVTDTTSTMIYSMAFDVSNQADQAGKDAQIDLYTGRFEPLMARIKEMSEN